MTTDTSPAQTAAFDPRITFDDIIDYARCEVLSAHILSQAMPDVPIDRADARLIKVRDAMVNLVIDNAFDLGGALDAFGDADHLRERCTATREAAAELKISAVC